MAAPGFRITVSSIFSVLAAIAGTVIYLTQFSESGKLSLAERFDPKPDVDSYLENIEGLKYRPDGSVAYRWQARSAERMTLNGEVVLHSPNYIGNIGAQRPWTAQANNGRLSRDGQQLDLSDNVVVKDLIREAEIRTEALKIDLQRSLVSTDQALSLNLRNGTTQSVGMTADLANERIELLDQVKGHYEPL